MPKRFLIVTKSPSGAAELNPMKEWLRKHLELMPSQHRQRNRFQTRCPKTLTGLHRKCPPGFSPQHKTSHQLRNELRKLGWEVRETEQEVRLMRPETADDPGIIDVLGEPDNIPESDVDEEEELGFSLESQLRDFIAHNLANLPIAPKRLKLYVGPGQREGIEYPTAVGPIDILAVDEHGNFVVFELKLTRGADKVMGQLLRYMGWIKHNLSNGKEVYGVIVAKDINEKLRYAALLVPNVSLLEYELEFRLKSAGLSG